MAAGLIGLAGSVAGGQVQVEDGLTARAAIEAERAVMLDLRLRSQVLPEDYLAVAGALSLIRGLAPDDAGLLRRAIAAAFEGGDSAQMESLTRELVRLDPEDTVAQLRLISLLIARSQTVEARVSAYERFLGPKGRRLDASVRSRLAVDAALLQRELGNQSGFVELLSQATSLDSTNKEAASLAAQFFAARMSDPMGRLELQVNLLYADPVDPNVHATISRALLAEGAFEQARRFFLNSSRVAKLIGRDDENLKVKQLELEFLIDDPGSVADSLQAMLAEVKIDAQRRLDYLLAQDLPLGDAVLPEDVRLARHLEFLRLLAADAAGREQQRRDSLDGLTLTIAAEMDSLFEAGASETDPEQRTGIIREMVSRFVQLQVVRLLLGIDTELVEESMTDLAGRLEGTDAIRGLLAPWILLAAGDEQAALDLLEGIENSGLADLCAGTAEARLGNTARAVALLTASANELSNPALSAWARRLAIETGGEDSVITDRGRAMAAFVDRVPLWIDRMVSDPSSFMLLRVESVSSTVLAGEEAVLRIQLENIAPIPLGLGADRTISSRLLVLPSLDLEAAGFVGLGQPEIVELDQRLRLKPGQSVVVEVTADLGYTGWLIGSNAHVTMRERWRVLQDFQIGTVGVIEAGPVALVGNTGSVHRRATGAARLSVAELTTRVEEATAEELPAVLLAVRTVLLHPEMEETRSAGVDELVGALSARFARASSVERVLLLATLPHGEQTRTMRGFDAVVLQEAVGGSTVELAMVLLTRVTDPESALLDEAESSGDASLETLARVLRSRLTEKRETLALVGGAYDDLAGLTPSRFVGADGR